MTATYVWTCGCGHTGKGEAAAQRHVRGDGCTLMGWPGTNPDALARAVERVGGGS